MRDRPIYQVLVEDFKRRLLLSALDLSGGNRSLAARTLGLSRPYFVRLVHELRVPAPEIPERYKASARRGAEVAARRKGERRSTDGAT